MTLITNIVHCETITTFAGGGSSLGVGPASSASLGSPSGLAYDPYRGAIIITEFLGYRIRSVSLTTGIITTIAGDGTAGYSGDGGLAISARLYMPKHAIYAPDGCLYIADTGNNVVRKVDVSGEETPLFFSIAWGLTAPPLFQVLLFSALDLLHSCKCLISWPFFHRHHLNICRDTW